MDDVLVEVGNHGVAEVADGGAVLGGVGLPGHGNTGGALEAVLEALGVGSDGVGQGVHAGSEHILGLLEGGGGVGLGGGQGSLEGGQSLLLGSRVLGEVGSLLGGGGLVLVHDLTDDTTGSLVGGVGGIGELDQALHLTGDDAVDLELGGLVGHNHGGDILDLTDNTGLGLLGEGLGLGNAGHHGLAGGVDIAGSSGAGSLQVLDGLGEAGILEGALLGNDVVEVGHGTGEGLVGVLAVLTHLDVDGGELLVGLLAGLLDTILDSLDDLVVASRGGGVHGSELGIGGLASGIQGRGDGGGVGLHLGADLLGVLDHGASMRSDLLVGLLDLVVHLLGRGKESLVLGSDSVVDLAHSVLLVGGDLGGKRSTLTLGLVGLGLEVGVQLGDLGVDRLGERGDLVGDTLVHGGTGLGVDV